MTLILYYWILLINFFELCIISECNFLDSQNLPPNSISKLSRFVISTTIEPPSQLFLQGYVLLIINFMITSCNRSSYRMKLHFCRNYTNLPSYVYYSLFSLFFEPSCSFEFMVSMWISLSIVTNSLYKYILFMFLCDVFEARKSIDIICLIFLWVYRFKSMKFFLAHLKF